MVLLFVNSAVSERNLEWTSLMAVENDFPVTTDYVYHREGEGSLATFEESTIS